MDEKLIHCRDDDPKRCEYLGPNRQCSYLSVEGSKFCSAHGGAITAHSLEKKSLSMYRFTKYKQRVDDLVRAHGLRTIDEELAVLRVVLEETINQCHDELTLLLYSSKIQELVREIRHTVLAADKLATKSGMLMGRAEVLILGQKIIDVLGSEISDDETLLRISDKIAEAFLTPIEAKKLA